MEGLLLLASDGRPRKLVRLATEGQTGVLQRLELFGGDGVLEEHNAGSVASVEVNERRWQDGSECALQNRRNELLA